MQRLPAQPGRDMLLRGRERYAIYCMPCHSPLGDGDGRVVQRGFPAPPSYHAARLLDAPDRHFYDVISQGYGVMAPYASRILRSGSGLNSSAITSAIARSGSITDQSVPNRNLSWP